VSVCAMLAEFFLTQTRRCMRRLQSNLGYMAALADRKPDVKVPPCPHYLMAPPLNLSVKLRSPAQAMEGADPNMDLQTDRAARDKSLKDLYKRLQAVFPGIDWKKEPANRMSNAPPNAPPKNNLGAFYQPSPSAQKTPQMSNMPAPPTSQGGLPS
jgi:hypothetical protein